MGASPSPNLTTGLKTTSPKSDFADGLKSKLTFRKQRESSSIILDRLRVQNLALDMMYCTKAKLGGIFKYLKEEESAFDHSENKPS
ncbi:hypothetical protein Plhal304r1_c015g0054551 [Plasmopara halstedii]